ncbi:DoxX family protein [Longimycelium tulufanense]|uniref:DoxX family protein n=1 Tax=Longimycelium tulufanense TaxID=907463 RepID=UPI00166544C6|nr:hypothetical protein [Longimycelium tulufanense]
MRTRSSQSATALAGFLAGAGALHFLAPAPYDGIVPRALPGRPRTWTYLSGLAELGCAGLVAARRTRRSGALLAALLFIAVFPANVRMAVEWSKRPWPYRLAAFGRLPLQVPLVLWALRVHREAAKDQEVH